VLPPVASVQSSFTVAAGEAQPEPKVEKIEKFLVVMGARFPTHSSYDFSNPLQQQAYWLAKRLEEKHDVTVVCREGSTPFKSMVVFSHDNEKVAFAEFKEQVTWKEYDLVVDFSTEKWSYQMAREKNLRVLYVTHPLLGYVTPPPLRYPCMTGVSNAHCAHLSREMGVPIRKLPFGYELEGEFKREDKDYLLYFGRIVKEKGVHELISLCKKRRLELIVAGDDRSDMGIEPEYVHRILEECDGGMVHYVGSVDESVKLKLISQAHALVMPYLSDSDAFTCLTAKAATLLKVPVIALKRGAVSEFIEQGENGVYVNSIEDLDSFDFEHLELTWFDDVVLESARPAYGRFEALIREAIASPW
jgi:glycosyltransferase involved in cell wall biosynthesis